MVYQHQFQHLRSVLVANRGEIACRIIETCKKNGIRSVAIYSHEDTASLHVLAADEAVLLSGDKTAGYIDIDLIISIAKQTKVDAVIPGYGFLSENPDFARKIEEIGCAFLGPSSNSIEEFGLKHVARSVAIKAKVPVLPGSGTLETTEDAVRHAAEIGYPVLLKATAGGGGMGLSLCETQAQLIDTFEQTRSRGKALFKNGDMFLEKYIRKGHHIEVQIFGNGTDVIDFGERECSVQRRHQKIIEETPSPFVCKHPELRKALTDCAVSLGKLAKYKSAGTVEFLVDDETASFYFLEVNTRLQVEHGITELCYGVDLVLMMLIQGDYELGRGTSFPLEPYSKREPCGHAIEIRVCAENPLTDFSPSPGILDNVEFPEIGTILDSKEIVKARVDHWLSRGLVITPFFDPLLAKIMIWSTSRKFTIDAAIKYLSCTKIQGPPNNLNFAKQVLDCADFRKGHTLTSILETFDYHPPYMQFITAGAYTTIQQLPGRTKVNGGIPLSGPMDSYSSQVANILVGNDRTVELLEICLRGPTVKFYVPADFAVCGGDFKLYIDGQEKPTWAAHHVPAGTEIAISACDLSAGSSGGSKCYLAVKGGFPQIATYLGSKSCTPTLKFGGYQGRTLRDGDTLEIFEQPNKSNELIYQLPKICVPSILDDGDDDDIWYIRAIPGPHDTSEVLSQEGRDLIYNSVWTINHNSNRGGIRLDGPKPIFSRSNGGDGGGHPSNILEYPYPTCGFSFTGDSAVIYGVDGGTLSGFVCACVPIRSDWWKFGQAKPGQKIMFVPVTWNKAIELAHKRDRYLEKIATYPCARDITPFEDAIASVEEITTSSILYTSQAEDIFQGIEVRQAGECMLLIDFGIIKFDIFNCGRQMAITKILEQTYKQVIEKGVNRIESVHGGMAIVYNPNIITQEKLVNMIESVVSGSDHHQYDLSFPSRIYRLPVSLKHGLIEKTNKRYMETQRPYASYLPDNAKYLMEANGIGSMDELKTYLLGQNQLIVAVSFLCALPLMVQVDPRKRLLSPKFNPARTLTPAGSVGTGSMVQCIYSVESPGGYMIWGQTLPCACWDPFSTLSHFNKDRPWLFKIFDQVIFYEVDEETLDKMNQDILIGKAKLEYEETTFDFSAYNSFVSSIEDEVEAHQKKIVKCNETAMKREEQLLEQWEKEKAERGQELLMVQETDDPNLVQITASMAANIWKFQVSAGDEVEKGDIIVILEAMKMEIAVRANESLTIVGMAVAEGQVVSAGDTLVYAKYR